jgi:DNA-binding NarL/FixJ family response regulator
MEHTTQAQTGFGPAWREMVLPSMILDEVSSASGGPFNISIVSNSHILCEGLARLLPEYLNISFLGLYSSDNVIPGDLPDTDDHIVLLDSGAGRQVVMEWIREWSSRTPPASIIVMELGDDPDIILACIEAGVCGYLPRSASVLQAAEMITQVGRGNTVCAPGVILPLFQRIEHLVAGTAESSDPLELALTPRELEVLHYVDKGWSNQEIANELVIAIYTVKHHVHNILEKLKVKRRWEAARLARKQGWLE